MEFHEPSLNVRPLSCVQSLVFTDECHTRLRHSQPLGQVPLFVGDNKAVLICSGPLTSTPQHFEDNLAAAVNFSALGFKLWEIMNNQAGQQYWKNCCSQQPQLACAVFDKQQYMPLAMTTTSPDLQCFIQVPGMLVYTLPGFSLHSTTACGLSMAVAANLFSRDSNLQREVDEMTTWASSTPGADTKGRAGSMRCIKENILMW